jgi:hypothetical protein
MWKKARDGIFIPKLNIMIPSCLRVERAIIFLKSHSVVALRPVMNVVDVAMIRSVVENIGRAWRDGWNRIRRKTPAVTNVDE